MIQKRTRARIAVSCMALMGLGFLADIALAQSDYPMNPRHRRIFQNMDMGSFDVEPGKSQTIVDIDEPETYRVCWTGALGQFEVDGERHVMDRGDCFDVTGKRMTVHGGSEGSSEGHGIYERMAPGAVIMRRNKSE